MRAICCLPIATLLLAIAPAADAGPYTFSPLPPPPAPFTVAYPEGINDGGQIAGILFPTPSKSFLLSGGAYTTFSYPGAENQNTWVFGVNNLGDTVGNFGNPNYNGFLRQSNGTTVPIQVPGSQVTIPYGINNTGTIVGYYQVPGDPAYSHGFIRDAKGNLVTLDVTGAFSTQLFGINDKGQIVGGYIENNIRHGFIYQNGMFTDLGPSNTFLRNINDVGDIVGNTYDGNNLPSAFLLRDGLYTPIQPPGADYTYVNGINDAGQLVGAYRPHGGSFEVGYVTNANPVPEPASLVLLVIASSGVIASGRCYVKKALRR